MWNFALAIVVYARIKRRPYMSKMLLLKIGSGIGSFLTSNT
jgi:hypothetical protein